MLNQLFHFSIFTCPWSAYNGHWESSCPAACSIFFPLSNLSLKYFFSETFQGKPSTGKCNEATSSRTPLNHEEVSKVRLVVLTESGVDLTHSLSLKRKMSIVSLHFSMDGFPERAKYFISLNFVTQWATYLISSKLLSHSEQILQLSIFQILSLNEQNISFQYYCWTMLSHSEYLISLNFVSANQNIPFPLIMSRTSTIMGQIIPVWFLSTNVSLY